MSSPTFFADGSQMVERGPDEDDAVSQAPSSRGRAAAKATPIRAKRGKGTTLSSSFTSWRLTPATWKTLDTLKTIESKNYGRWAFRNPWFQILLTAPSTNNS